MLKTIYPLVKFYLIWIAIFFLERLIFIGYFYAKIFPISLKEFILTFLFGLRMDASMAAYICALPLLLFIFKWLIPSLKISAKVLRVYSLFLLVTCCLLSAINLNIYQEWGTKLPYRAISTFLEYPYQAFISSYSSPFVLPALLMLIVFFAGRYLLNKAIKQPIQLHGTKWFVKIPVSILLIGILFLFIRSGWQTTPLNPSMAYFSTKPILNHAAVNTEWNLLSDFLHGKGSDKNPYNYMEESLAQEEILPYINKESLSNPVKILNQPKPNVVLIILESFTSDLIESLGGEPGIAPGFEKLIQDGVLFTNIYSASDRTDKGIIASMSAFPSQATQSIIKNVNKLEHLPGIGQEFLENGYSTSFVHGGESEFYNFKSYMLSHGVQKVIDQYDFPLKDVQSKWGAFDHLAFQKQIEYLNQSPQPFFSTILTLSNHEPFDLPGPPKYGSDSQANLFRSTAFYTDSALYNYINRAKQTDWYKNTLFVIIADHGHRLPLDKWDSFHPNRYRIPFLLYGDVIKEEFRGQKIDKIGNQTDLVSTLLHQLNISPKPYFWSKDLLDPNTPPFAFFSYDNGFGVITPEQSLTFDNVGKEVIYLKDKNVQDSVNQNLQTIGQAYLQEVYNQYLNY
ncbi:LTA synthase family protein [Albibacterium bauzanense]|uniref:Phosphoglycerol transferase MdoB-like AlkP superfamily enzyme n=1 Tax=Albibacterium bauzanense TaxID=653929 RepID=A0A4R1LZL5_9SPHI|nr:alkaline phosphatase family protein [Albibacterium bauzanense]TCK84775.1 phosphoglycerol transferase MdoB-like AlkP superfamily enzyme [Albibacterium bauzanense]